MWLKLSASPIPESINFEDLSISFNDKYNDYLVYAPWNMAKYITYVGPYNLGMADRYQLVRTLDKIKSKYMDKIAVSDIGTTDLQYIEEPVVRRMGFQKYKGGPIEKRIQDQRRRFWLSNTSPAKWENTSGHEDTIKRVNRPEEFFEGTSAKQK